MRSGNTFNSPAVANGIVYAGCEGDIFYALDASTGTQIWNCSTGSSDCSTPAVAGGIVYVGTITTGVNALDADTGAKIWNYRTPSWVKSSPAVAGGIVYFGCADGNIYALDAYTGAKLWSYDTKSNSGVSSSPAVVGGVVYIGANNHYVYAFGKAVKPAISLSPMFGLAGSAVTVSGCGFAAGSALAATFGGAPITLNGASIVNSTGQFFGTFTVSSSAAPGNYTVSVNDASGDSASASFLLIAAPATSWPMFHYDQKHSGSPDNIAAVECNLLWSFTTSESIGNIVASSPAVVGGVVYVASEGGYVYALDAYTGACYWSFNAGYLPRLRLLRLLMAWSTLAVATRIFTP